MRKRLFSFFCVAVLTLSSVPEGALVSQAAPETLMTESTAEGNVALSIVRQPSDVTTASGKTVTFSIEAAGDGLKYQWQVKSDATSDWKNTTLTGAKTASLSVAATKDKSGRQYRCVVTDQAGASLTSNAATLTVSAGPVISAQPQDVSTFAGKTVTFSVVATGDGLKYRWQVKSDPNGTWKNTTLTGANTATLSVSASLEKSGRAYRCVVTDQYGVSVNTSAATLTVKASPVITKNPEDVITASGKTVTFSVAADGDGIKYQWQVKTDANSEWKNTTVTGYKTDTLTVKADESKSGRSYRCMVTDKSGKKAYSNGATLTVAAKPQITKQPENVRTAPGKKVTFSITATGEGLKYQWQVKADDTTAWKNTTLTGANTNKITVAATLEKSGKKYRCVITDQYGVSVKSNAAELIVVGAPTILAHPSKVEGYIGTIERFYVVAQDAVSYQWQRSKDGENWSNVKDDDDISGSETPQISFVITEEIASYQYRCVVKGEGGSTISESARIEWNIPTPVITSAVVKDEKITLEWGEIRGATYILLYAKSGKTFKVYSSSIEYNSVTVKNLEENTKYDFSVIAVVGDRESDMSDIVSATTKSASGEVVYRALLIGEENYTPMASRNRGDVNMMYNMLLTVKGGEGGSYSGNITRAFNQTPADVKKLISTTFADADDNDVSLFFISCDGDASRSGAYGGALAMVDIQGNEETLLLQDLASWLKQVPGKVVVILESSGSGAALYASGVPENGISANDDGGAFAKAAVDTFASMDPGISSETEVYYDFINDEVHVSNTGEFRNAKFYVLCATKFLQISGGTESGQYNYFTRWLTDGIGLSGRMNADTNGDSKTTLNELFTYIDSRSKETAYTYLGELIYQHVQVYPANSDLALFKR